MKITRGSGEAGGDSLPPLYTFERHHERFGHLPPAARLAAFLALPTYLQAEAHLALQMERDGFVADDLDGSCEWEAA